MEHFTEAGNLISQELPELNERFEKSPVPGLHKTMRALFDYTQEKVDTYDLGAVQKCFSVVERLYADGNMALRNAIENVYVFSLEKILCSTCAHKAELMNMIPETLHAAYVRQMICSNI
ncbi:MAG: hypothetical protein K0R82_2517 [Flavipsychrobacter sp.]|jgi:hypothetical protein|nr:hypothetical protein [Flavipsychrobacter sp.]